MKDVYKTIENPSPETLFKEKGSKFFGYTFPVTSEDEVKNCLEEIKKQHHSARHFCYAYQIGVQKIKFRVNDDGEPNNSAGMPIYGQIQSFGVTNILVISVRYFGGTKLGVGGLISAYKTSAQLALEASTIVEKTVDVFFQLKFNYDKMSIVQRIIKEKDISLIHQKLEMDCEFVIAVRKKLAKQVFQIFEELYLVQVKKLETHSS